MKKSILNILVAGTLLVVMTAGNLAFASATMPNPSEPLMSNPNEPLVPMVPNPNKP